MQGVVSGQASNALSDTNSANGLNHALWPSPLAFLLHNN